MAVIFNDPGGFHSFEVPDDGALRELYGNPPDTINDILPAGTCKPGAEVSVGRINYDPANPFYKSYFVSTLHSNGVDILIMIWTSTGWTGPHVNKDSALIPR